MKSPAGGGNTQAISRGNGTTRQHAAILGLDMFVALSAANYVVASGTTSFSDFFAQVLAVLAFLGFIIAVILTAIEVRVTWADIKRWSFKPEEGKDVESRGGLIEGMRWDFIRGCVPTVPPAHWETRSREARDWETAMKEPSDGTSIRVKSASIGPSG